MPRVEGLDVERDVLAGVPTAHRLPRMATGHIEHHPTKLQPRVTLAQPGTFDDPVVPAGEIGALDRMFDQVGPRPTRAFDHARRGTDLLAAASKVPQLRVLLQGLHDLVVSNRSPAAGP